MGEKTQHEGHRQRLRERFLKSGLAGFVEHEIVELLLTLCIPRRDVKPAAKTLLQRFGTLRAILDAPVSDLQQVSSIGEVAPVALCVIREAATLYPQAGKYRLLVKVVDIFGNDTTQAFEMERK